MKVLINPSPLNAIHPCDMLPGQTARVVGNNGPMRDDAVKDTNRNSIGDILLCCAWGNKDRTIVNLSQPSGCWEEVSNDVMLVELLPSGTEIKLTVEV